MSEIGKPVRQWEIVETPQVQPREIEPEKSPAWQEEEVESPVEIPAGV